MFKWVIKGGIVLYECLLIEKCDFYINNKEKYINMVRCGIEI